MNVSIFFSWQSDRPSKVCKNFIEDALEKAAKNISNDLVVEETIRVDKDTEDVPGTPPVFDTICRKIEAAAGIIGDVTFVATRPKGEPTPNPNVLMEYGYALKAITYNRIILVMNTAYGEPGRDMPFDMASNRFPIRYCVAEDATEEIRKAEKQKLVKSFENAIRVVLESEQYKASRATPVEAPYRQPAQGHSLFHMKDHVFGYERKPFGRMLSQSDSKIFITEKPALWFRLSPKVPVPETFKLSELEKQVMQLVTLPLFGRTPSTNLVRRSDGWAVGIVLGGPLMPVMCHVFTDAEIWAVDQFTLGIDPDLISIQEDNIAESLLRCHDFLTRLSIPPPFRMIVGIEGILGRSLVVADRSFQRKFGPCATDRVEIEPHLVKSASDCMDALESFYEQLYEQCGLPRPPRKTATSA